MDVTTEVRTAASSTASQTIGTMTVEPTTEQPMTTTSEGSTATTTMQNDQPTTQAATTLSSDESTSAGIDTTMIKDDVISTIAPKSAGSVDLKTIIGVIISAVLLIVTGLVVAIIVAINFKRRGKRIGGYSFPGKITQSNEIANGVGKSSDSYYFS